jgi:UDP-N-acetylmuramate--alanine ligase
MQTKLKYKHIRFLGAEGIGMSALIRIIEERKTAGIYSSDLKISKSDLSYKQNDPLDADIDLVVRSTAINAEDPEYKELVSRKIEIWHRSDMLNFLSEGYKQIVVSGTHGKTTTSAMLAHILVYAGLNPSFAIGGILSNYNSNGKGSDGQYFVLEGDESDKSFMKTNPYLAVVTSVEPDHLENYPGGFQEIQNCFYSFLDRANIRIICNDDPSLEKYQKESIRYSKNDLVNYSFKLKLAGIHNYSNALAALLAAKELGVDPQTSIEALEKFTGIQRRFELINENYNGSIKVYDDYAHHPTEIKAVLEGALSLKPQKLVFVYQPHHPERTKQLWKEFVEVFKTFPGAPHIALIADVYVARSKHIPGIDSKSMVKEINKENVLYLEPIETNLTSQGNLSDMKAALKPNIDKHLGGCDYLFIVGAGNISKTADGFKR